MSHESFFPRPWCSASYLMRVEPPRRARKREFPHLYPFKSFLQCRRDSWFFTQHQRHVLAITSGRLFQIEKERRERAREKLIPSFLNDFWSETAIKKTIVWYSVKSNIYLKSKRVQIKRGGNLFEWKSEVPAAYERRRAKLVCKTR